MVLQDRTLAILKPDAVGHPWLFVSKKPVEDEEGNVTEQEVVETIAEDKAAKMRERIVREGFEIEKERRVCLSLDRAKDFYKEHEGKPFFDELVAYMCSGPVDVLVLKREDAIQSWRQLMGPTNPEVAREMEEDALLERRKNPARDDNEEDDEQEESEMETTNAESEDGWEVMENWCLRAAFGANVTRNSCHGSDSEFSAMREINFFFPPEPRMERTLVIVKPHVLNNSRGDEARKAIKSNGLMICGTRECTLSKEEAQQLLADEEGGLLYDEHVESLTEGPSLALVVEGDNAYIKARLAIGPENCTKGLRASFGTDEVKSGFHIATTNTRALENLALLFPESLQIERSVCIIKPFVTCKSKAASDILNTIRSAGFEVIAQRNAKLTAYQISELVDGSQDEVDRLHQELGSGTSLALILAKAGAVDALNVIVGPECASVALKTAPSCINAKYNDGQYGAAYTVKSTMQAKRAATALFSQISNDEVTDVNSVFERTLKGSDHTFQQILVEGLTHICRQKPRRLDAIRMLGEWLLEHNPNKLQQANLGDNGPEAAPVQPPALLNNERKGAEETPSKPVTSTELNSLPNLGMKIPIPVALDNRRVIFVFGPPGCGKRTQCKLVTDAYGFAHISPASLIKAEVESGTHLGLEIESLLKSGTIVPANTIVTLIRKAMKRTGKSKFLIDNFPRDLNQAFAFEQQVCPCESVIRFQCPEHLIVSRTLESSDTTAEEVQKQITSFHERSTPVIEFYKKIGKVKDVDASSPSIKRVFHSVRKHIEPRVVFVFGGPGSGKTSLCQRVAKEFGYVHLCASKLLRDLASKGTEEGQRLKRIIARGQLVPTEEMMSVLRQAMDEYPGDKFILDGFPRSLKQYHAFESQVTKAAFAIYLRVPIEQLRTRATLNKTGGFKKRMRMFQNEELPVVNAMQTLGLVREYDASGNAEQIWNAVRMNFVPDIVIALGPPGSEVSKYCEELGKRFNYTVLKENSIIEAEVLQGGSEANTIDEYKQKGEELPIDLKLKLFTKVISNSGNHKFIVEGFPQYVEVLPKWEAALGQTKKVIYFDTPETKCLEHCSSEDLDIFNTKTLPLINQYARSGVLVTVNAAEEADQVLHQASKVFQLEYVVVVGNGKLPEKAVAQACEKLAVSQNYQLVDVPQMIQEAEGKSGALEGELARAKRHDVVEALLRSAHESSGKGGLLIRHFPQTSEKVVELIHALGRPRRVFHINCPVSVIRDEVLSREGTEEEAEAAASTYASRVQLVEEPVVEAFRAMDAPVTVVQNASLTSADISGQLTAPFQPELYLLVGRSGTGRGMLATELARHHGFVHLQATALLKEEVARGTESGRVIAQSMALQRAVPLEHAVPVLKSAIVRHGASRYLLDGFPRMVGDGYPMVHDQFFALEEEIGPVRAVVHLEVPEDVRLSRTADLSQEEQTKSKERYVQQKLPVLEFCKTLSPRLVINVDASPEPPAVATAVIGALAKQKEEEEAELRKLTLTAQDIMNEKIANVVAEYEADESHVEAVEKYFSQFDLNGDGQLTFGEMVAKMQAWGLEQDPKDYMGVKSFEDDSIITKDEWYKFILTAVFLLGKKPDETNAEENEEEEEA